MPNDNEPTLNELFPEGSRIFVHASPCGRRQTWGRREGNHVVLEEYEDESIAIEEARLAADHFNRTGSHGDGLIVAKLPRIIAQKMRVEEWDEKDKARWLNDADNARFRTNPGWRV